MKRGLFIVFVLIVTSVNALVDEPILTEEQEKQIEEISESIEDFIQRVAEAELENYNRLKVTITDMQGNPRDCTIRVWYDDFIQEYATTKNGKYDNVFLHGKQLPTKMISFAIWQCPCWAVAADITGPNYPALNDLLEKIKKVAAEDIQEKTKEKAREVAEDVTKTILKKVFEGMGMSAELAGIAIGSFKLGMDLGQPIGDYITKKIEEIFQQMREYEKLAHQFDWNQPWFPRKWTRTPWVDEWISWHKPITEYEIKLKVDCDEKYEPVDVNIGLGWHETNGFPRLTPSPKISDRTKERELPVTPEPVPEPPSVTVTQPLISFPQITPPSLPPKKPECLKCKPILDWINQKQHEYEALVLQAKSLEPEIATAINSIAKTEKELKRAKEALERFDNPKNWASSEGRTVTQTDIEVYREAMQEAWNNYMHGSWTAEDLTNYWNSFTDEQREKYKQKARQRLLNDISKAETEISRLKQKLSRLQEQQNKLLQEANEVLDEIENLKKQYQECLLTCMDEKQVKEYVILNPSCGLPKYNDQKMCEAQCPGTCIAELGQKCFTCLPSCTHKNAPPGLFETEAKCKESCEGTCEETYLQFPNHPQAQSTKCFKCARKPCTEPTMNLESCKKTCKGECKQTTNNCYKCEKTCGEGYQTRDECFENCRKPNICKQLPLGTSKNAGCWNCEPPSCDQILYQGSQTFNTPQACKNSCPGICYPRTVPNVGITCYTCQRETVLIPDSYVSIPSTAGYKECVCPTGHTKEPPSPEYILGVLQKYTCVSGVRIYVPSIDEKGCYCYGQPQISVDEKPAVCETKCGPVRCGMTTTCQCPDKPNCVITATCNWAGWKHTGGNTYTAVLK